jgi:hypothetical protein
MFRDMLPLRLMKTMFHSHTNNQPVGVDFITFIQTLSIKLPFNA